MPVEAVPVNLNHASVKPPEFAVIVISVPVLGVGFKPSVSYITV